MYGFSGGTVSKGEPTENRERGIWGTMIDETQSSQAISRAVEAKREYMRKALREDNLFHYESQTTCCTPIFGDMTEQVIDDFFRGRSLEKNHMQGILIL